MRYAVGKGASSSSPPATSSRTATRRSARTRPASSPRSRRASRARSRSRRSIASKNHALYSTTGSYVEIWRRRAGRVRGFGRDGFVLQQTFDFNFTDTFAAPAVAVHGAALRRLRLLRLHRHVDGGAACRRRRGDADAAGHHRPGGDRSGAREDLPPTSARRAATTLRLRAGRCAGGAARTGAGEMKTTRDPARALALVARRAAGARAGSAGGRRSARSVMAAEERSPPWRRSRPSSSKYAGSRSSAAVSRWTSCDGFVVEVGASRFKKTGERAFRINGENFRWGFR